MSPYMKTVIMSLFQVTPAYPGYSCPLCYGGVPARIPSFCSGTVRPPSVRLQGAETDGQPPVPTHQPALTETCQGEQPGSVTGRDPGLGGEGIEGRT